MSLPISNDGTSLTISHIWDYPYKTRDILQFLRISYSKHGTSLWSCLQMSVDPGLTELLVLRRTGKSNSEDQDVLLLLMSLPPPLLQRPLQRPAARLPLRQGLCATHWPAAPSAVIGRYVLCSSEVSFSITCEDIHVISKGEVF